MTLKNNSKLKVCLAASAGGHLTQLLKLENSWKDREFFFVTTTDVVKGKLEQSGKTYVVGECNHKHPFDVIKVLLNCIKIAFTEKFDVVISTGAAAGCLMCFLGKLKGAKIIWLDSITNVKKMSLSGRMVRHIADLSLVQWSELAEQYKNVEYAGAVI